MSPVGGKRPADSRIGEPAFELGEKQSGRSLGSPDQPSGESFMRHAISFALLGATPALLGCSSLDRATDVATGYVSHQLCSATFVSRVEPEQFYREAIAPILAPVSFLSGHRVARAREQVTASFAGVSQARAIDRGPLGCLVGQGEPPAPVALPPHTPAPALLPGLAGPPP